MPTARHTKKVNVSLIILIGAVSENRINPIYPILTEKARKF